MTAPPDMRLKLTAPFFYGSLPFVNTSSRRRGSGTIRWPVCVRTAESTL
jgi:hypothetical protein